MSVFLLYYGNSRYIGVHVIRIPSGIKNRKHQVNQRCRPFRRRTSPETIESFGSVGPSISPCFNEDRAFHFSPRTFPEARRCGIRRKMTEVNVDDLHSTTDGGLSRAATREWKCKHGIEARLSRNAPQFFRKESPNISGD